MQVMTVLVCGIPLHFPSETVLKCKENVWPHCKAGMEEGLRGVHATWQP